MGQLLGEESCVSEDKPQVENICDDNPECHHQAPQSSNVEHGKPPSKSEEGASPQVASWVKGDWTQVRTRLNLCIQHSPPLNFLGRSITQPLNKSDKSIFQF